MDELIKIKRSLEWWLDWIFARVEFSEFDRQYRFKWEIPELKNPEFEYFCKLILKHLNDLVGEKLKRKEAK